MFCGLISAWRSPFAWIHSTALASSLAHRTHRSRPTLSGLVLRNPITCPNGQYSSRSTVRAMSGSFSREADRGGGGSEYLARRTRSRAPREEEATEELSEKGEPVGGER